MSCSGDEDVILEHVRNGQYVLLLKVDLNSNEILSFGDHITMNAFKNDPNFKNKLLTAAAKHKDSGETLIFEKSDNPDSEPDCEYDYSRLFVDPKNMTLSDVRLQLSSYLGYQGWGRNTLKRYGVGVPPVGYPNGSEWTGPQWTDFKGVSKISKQHGIQIIFSLLRAQHIDPEEHGPLPDLEKTAGSEEEIEVRDVDDPDSENDKMSVESNDFQGNTSMMRRQLIDNMDKAMASLDSSTETDSHPKHSKPAISEILKESANIINCSLDKLISLVRCDKCEFVAENKNCLTWHVRKHHCVLESHQSEGNNSTKRRRKPNKKYCVY